MVNGGLNILQHARRRQRLHRRFQGNASLHVSRFVAQLHPGLDPVKRGRRQRHIARRSKTIGHGADVGIDAKNLLQHHHCALGRAHRVGLVDREGVVVGGC